MAPPTGAKAAPTGRPAIPFNVASEDVVAIVIVHHADAPKANLKVPHPTSSVMANGARASRRRSLGENIYLRQIDGQYCYTFGRQQEDKTKANRDHDQLDVSLPGTSTAIDTRQCSLVPVWEKNAWRIQSISEKITTVNGVPLQNYTSVTKKQSDPLPHAIYLKQSEVNTVVVDGMLIEIWLLQSVRELFEEDEFKAPTLHARVQDVTHRPEPWARERWHLTNKKVAGKSFRAMERFTGELQTAKLFGPENRHRRRRDREFLLFNRQEVDASIVRYLYSTELSKIPAVITDSHEGFVSYAAIQEEIQKSHPGARFEIATTLHRRLFSGIGYLHFHHIIHGRVSHDNVIMKMVDGKVDRVLLVGYTHAQPFDSSAPLPVDQITADGRAAMEIVEDCCDIWAFRNGPSVKALGEETMQRRTNDLMKTYQTVRRVAADFYERQGGSHVSEMGKKLDRLVLQSSNDWHSAQNAQQENRDLREIKPMSRSKVQGKIEDWYSAHKDTPRIGAKQYMLLSLGHPYLDSLANGLYLKRWNLTPHEVCVKMKEFGGVLEQPWQTFEVRKATKIMPEGSGHSRQSIMEWLASCCEIFPEWREALETEVDRHIREDHPEVDRKTIGDLRMALREYGQLPQAIVAMFDLLMATDDIPDPVEETYQVWYHIPSRLFNITQLHRLATPERTQCAINEDRLPCENFVEVRGDPRVEGCYAPLTALVSFCRLLALELPQCPELLPMPTLDPSDFSGVQPGRIVLARPGLLGFASMTRSGDQCIFLNPKAPEGFQTENVFVPTYFGDMPVLPKLPYSGRHYERPGNWSKFKTSAETEAERRKAQLLASSNGSAGPVNSIMDMNFDVDVDESMEAKAETTLGKLLREREGVRATAGPPPKRAASEGPDGSRESSPARKRARVDSAAPLPEVTDSFIMNMEKQAQAPVQKGRSQAVMLPTPQSLPLGFMGGSAMGRGGALFATPPEISINQSFTVADDDEMLEQDWKAVNDLLSQMPDEDDEEEEPFTAFRVHVDDGSDTDVDEELVEVTKDATSTKVDHGSFLGRYLETKGYGTNGKDKGGADKDAQSASQSFEGRAYGSFGSHGQSLFESKSSYHTPPHSSFGLDQSQVRKSRDAPEVAGDADLPPTQSSSPFLPPAQEADQTSGPGIGELPTNGTSSSFQFDADMNSSFNFGSGLNASFPPPGASGSSTEAATFSRSFGQSNAPSRPGSFSGRPTAAAMPNIFNGGSGSGSAKSSFSTLPSTQTQGSFEKAPPTPKLFTAEVMPGIFGGGTASANTSFSSLPSTQAQGSFSRSFGGEPTNDEDGGAQNEDGDVPDTDVEDAEEGQGGEEGQKKGGELT